VFSLFRSRRTGETEVVSNEREFFRRYERRLPPRSIFDKQGEAHAELDLELTRKLEDLLRPKLGAWEQSDRWFHQMDFYGDGVRSLIFRRNLFPSAEIPAMRALLVGVHADFTILCCATDELLASEEQRRTIEDDYLAIWQHGLLVTRQLANLLTTGDA
jgi:hypothetical protein